MSPLQLVYESAIPLSNERHRDCFVEAQGHYGFSRKVNSVPLTAVEFREAASEYPIVFAKTGDGVLPVVVLGVRAQENLYLKPDDAWDAQYVPAFLRRYPFIFGTPDEGKSFTLCVDESFPGLNREGRGQRLFTEDGDHKATPYVEGVLKFLQEYRAHFLRTEAFCKRLIELGLLESMLAQFQFGEEKTSLGGFMVVDRKKLKALDGATLAQLMQNDELELLFLHQQSLRNFGRLKDRLAARPAG
ncbi:SapC family protein [Aquabacterium sp. J223]|uniref:SapC family protein n=1 Tax=Aquabacterium sp. J223 TaxID=2898431 RepID=UPI0021AD565F|nr:SapC family protein [Aquabacterium sp. J223]UUX95427.1 SapC family protein [Aquabacterium sp. J223]